MARLLIITSSFPRWKGDSTQPVAFGLAKSMVNKGHSVSVLAPHHQGAKMREEMDGVEVIRHPYFYPFRAEKLCYGPGIPANLKSKPWLVLLLPFLVLSQILFTAKFLASRKVDSVYAFWLIPQGFTGALLKPFFKFRLVNSAIDSDVLQLNDPFSLIFKRIALEGSDSVIAVSPMMQDEVAARFPPQKKKIRVIPFGIDADSFKPISRRKGKTVLFVGRLVEWKGARTLIRAIPLVLKKEPSAKFRVAGTGPLEGELRALAKKLGVEESVEFMGAVPHERLVTLMSESALLAHPANERGGRETLGMAVLEAMACGLPVIASRTGGLPFVLDEGRAGILVKPESEKELAGAIIKVLSDAPLREALGRKARQRAERFSWGRLAPEFESAIFG